MAQDKNASDYISPLLINGLEGRMLLMPAPKKYANRNILIVYGHHSDIERWFGLAQVINRYGAVTMPDLPGFGGMTPLHKIGLKPNLDNIAGYLASFIKMRFKRKRLVIVGLSFGFLLTTRMLQRYPEIAKKVDFLVSAVGFAHHDDFLFSKGRKRFYKIGSKIVGAPIISNIYRHTALSPIAIKKIYGRTHNAKHKFEGVDKSEQAEIIKREIDLWHNNDPKTHWRTTIDMLTADNCADQVDLPVWHVYSPNDNYFDNNMVEQHYKVIFKSYHGIRVDELKHVPSIIASAKESEILVPPKLRSALAKSTRK